MSIGFKMFELVFCMFYFRQCFVIQISPFIYQITSENRHFFYKYICTSNFHSCLWIQREKCIQISINKPTIGSMVLKIALWV